MRCIFTLDDFCFKYEKCLFALDKLANHFPNFKVSLYTIPCYENDFLSNHLSWLKNLPPHFEYILHGWNHTNHEFRELSYIECREKINLGIYEFMECDLPIIKGFKAPNWKYNNHLIEVLKEKGFWLSIYTMNSHKGIVKDIDIPVHVWNWDIKTPVSNNVDLIHAHGHVHSCSGPGGGITEFVDNVMQLPKETEFLFLSEIKPLSVSKHIPPTQHFNGIKEPEKNIIINKEQEKIDVLDDWTIQREIITQTRVNKWNTETSILVTGHSEQRMFLLSCLTSIKSLGWILLVYDRPSSFVTSLPNPEALEFTDHFFIKHKTSEIPGPTYPQFWNFRHGIDILKGSKSKYIFVIGADSILEKPEGISEIFNLLGDGDIISCATKRARHEQAYCNSKSFLAKKDVFLAMVDALEETFTPLNYKYGNMEARFGYVINKLDIKEVVVPEQPKEDQFAYHYDKDGKVINNGTWGTVLGFRHLGGEHKQRRLQKQIPIDEKYFDKLYLRRQELSTICKYWETGNKEFLKRWWES